MIPFPDHLKGKYQDYTCADMKWLKNYRLRTVEEYLQSTKSINIVVTYLSSDVGYNPYVETSSYMEILEPSLS